MPSFREVKMENGQVWAAGSWIINNESTWAQIIVPAEHLDEMTDEEIGRYVRQLAPRAIRLNAQEVASCILEFHPGPDERALLELEALERAATLELPAGERELIEGALRKVRGELYKRNNRPKMKAVRKGLASHYNDVFVALGRRDGFYCAHCGEATNDLQIDHIRPVSKGGGNNPDNLQLLCRDCNAAKGDREP